MFWIISAILVIIALAFIFPALLNRNYTEDATREQNISIAKEQLAEIELRFKQGDIDTESYQATKDELEQSLFNDLEEAGHKLTVSNNNPSKSSVGVDTWLILLIIPLITIPVYLNLGNLDFAKQLDPKVISKKAAETTMPLKADGTPDVEKIAKNFRAEMEKNPTDPKGWFMLGRTYIMLEQFPEAINSFDKSLSLRPESVKTLLALADALSMNNKGQLIGRARKLVNKALTIEPKNLTALWLSGMAASQDSEYVEAITQWRKLLPHLENKPDEKKAIIDLIAEAKSRLKPEQQTKLTNEDSKNIESSKKIDSAITNAGVEVSISLSEAFKDMASSDDYVFIYAKAMNGPPMPLAALRKQVKDLPLKVMLNDDMAMMPNLKLSSFKGVSVGARISKTGQPISQDGDLFVEKTGVNLGDSVTLEINEVFKK